MRYRALFFVVVLALLVSFAAGCTPTPPAPTETPAPSLTSTPDSCSVENVGAEARKIQLKIKEFDDINYVANLTPQQQLYNVVIELQRVRRETESMQVPGCVSSLQFSAVSYMNVVISYLADFMSGATRDKVNAQIIASQNLRVAYETEYARLTGTVYVPPPTNPPPPPEPTATSAPALVRNPRAQTINLRMAPNTGAGRAGALKPGEVAILVGRTQDGEWLLVQFPGTQNGGWVYTRLVETNMALDKVQVIDPNALSGGGEAAPSGDAFIPVGSLTPEAATTTTVTAASATADASGTGTPGAPAGDTLMTPTATP